MGKQQIFETLKKLDEETMQIFNSIEGLSEEDLSNKSYGWSIIQVLSHLNMAEFGSLTYMTKKMQAGEGMPEYAVSNKIKYFLTKRLLQSSLKWKAPKVVADPKDDYALSELKDVWRKTRVMAEKYISDYPDSLLTKAVYKHPFAGRLDLEGAISSFLYHQRHHVHQIRRIRKKIGR